MVRPLYTSADMEKDISIISDPVDGFQSVRGNFGVVFQGQSNGEVRAGLSGLLPPDWSCSMNYKTENQPPVMMNIIS